MGLYNAMILDDDFYAHAQEGVEITIDRKNKTIALGGLDKVFAYTHTQIEDTLLAAGGIVPLYALHGRDVFSEIISSPRSGGSSPLSIDDIDNPFTTKAKSGLEW
jgi:homoaconitate hydratase